MKNGRWLWLASLAGAGAALTAVLLMPRDDVSRPGAPPPTVSPTPSSSPSNEMATRPWTPEPVDSLAFAEQAERWGIPLESRGPMPRSLLGTDVDGRLELDADGHFLPNQQALRLFDYFLAASGEEPLDVIRGRIILQIVLELPKGPPPAREEAIAVLDRYLAYREAARELAEAGSVPHELEARWQWQRELRRKELGPGLADAFFGEQERVAMIDMARRRVAVDPELTEEQRAQRLAGLEEQLPPHISEARRRAGEPREAFQEAETLRTSGASAEEIMQARENRFGREAAERLADLDRRRAEWQARLDVYREALGSIETDPELSLAQREAAIEALRASHFSEHELPRVRALDRARQASAVREPLAQD